MTDQGTHSMDVVQWMTNSGPPRSAVCQGQVIGNAEAEAPDVFTAVFEYPGFLAQWTLDYCSTYDWDWSVTFLGDKASLVLDRTGYRLYRDNGASDLSIPASWRSGRWIIAAPTIGTGPSPSWATRLPWCSTAPAIASTETTAPPI